MSASTQFRRKFRKIKGALSPRRTLARMGNGSGVIDVPGVPGAVYVRPDGLQLPVIVHNFKVAQRNNKMVWIGQDSLNPGLTQVLGSYHYYGEPANSDVPPHATSHLWAGEDQIWLDTRQVLGMAAYSDGLTIIVQSGAVLGRSGVVRFEQQQIDLTSHAPTDSLYVLLTADDTGTLTATDGTEVAISDLSLADIPAIPDGHTPICAARMYAGQTAISMEFNNADLVDLRYLARVIGAETFLNLTDTPGSYAGYGGAGVVVNQLATGLEFTEFSSGGISALVPVILLDETAGAGGQAAFAVDTSTGNYASIEAVISGGNEDSGNNYAFIYASFNSDTTATNYRYTHHYASSALHDKTEDNGQIVGLIAGAQNAAMSGVARILIPDPGSIDLYKVTVANCTLRRSSTIMQTSQVSMQWESQDAITSIDFTSDADFAEGTRCVVTAYKQVFIPSVIESVTTTAINLTLDETHKTVLCTDTLTITLPAAGDNEARIYRIKNSGAGTVTVDGDGSEEIDGETTQTLLPNDSIEIQSDGSNWWIL